MPRFQGVVPPVVTPLTENFEVDYASLTRTIDHLIAGDRAKHNQMVLDAIRDLARRTDVIVCAQGSMMAIVPDLGPTPVPVLTSPRLGVQSAAEWLEKNARA